MITVHVSVIIIYGLLMWGVGMNMIRDNRKGGQARATKHLTWCVVIIFICVLGVIVKVNSMWQTYINLHHRLGIVEAIVEKYHGE